MSLRLSPLVRLVVLTLCSSAIASAQDSVHYHRRSLGTRSGELRFTAEIPTRPGGAYVAVSRDERGRVARVRYFNDSTESNSEVHRYIAEQSRASSIDEYVREEKTGVARIHLNDTGFMTRVDYESVDGASTGYRTFEDLGDSVQTIGYSPAGTMLNRAVYFYSAAGLAVGRRAFNNPADRTSFVFTEIDEQTGLERNIKQFRNGALLNTRTIMRNADDDPVRLDVFDPSGTLYASEESSAGLVTRRHYSNSRELRYSWDEKRRLTATELFFNGTLICRFTYDRLADGAIKGSVAKGPDGELWAEYPDNEVMDVQRDGRPVNNKPATIHKQGLWW